MPDLPPGVQINAKTLKPVLSSTDRTIIQQQDGTTLSFALGIIQSILCGPNGYIWMGSGAGAGFQPATPTPWVSTLSEEPAGPYVLPGFIWLPDADSYFVRNRANDGWMRVNWEPVVIIGTPEGDPIGTPEGDEISAV